MPLAALHRVEALKTLTTMLTTTESDMARSQRMASEAASQVSDGAPQSGRILQPGGLTALAAFWPHQDAQRCRLLRSSEYRLGSSAEEWAGSGCA